MQALSNEIRLLEERLLHSDMRTNPEIIDELLALEFEEISPVGQLTSRQSVIEWLYKKEVDARWEFQAFQVKCLSEELVLATYSAKQIKPVASKSLGSLRSSVWRKNSSDKNWQMVFHQATKIL